MQSPGDTQGVNKVNSKSELAALPSTKLAESDQAYFDKQQEEDWPDLSFQLRAFANEYVTNGYDHRKAAVTVGRAANSAKNMLRNPLVKHYINYLQNNRLDSPLVTRDFLDAKLEELHDIAMGNVEIPIVLADGTRVDECKFMGDLAFKTLQERAKLYGHAKPEPEGGGNGGVVVNIDVGALLGKSNGNNAVEIEGEIIDQDSDSE